MSKKSKKTRMNTSVSINMTELGPDGSSHGGTTLLNIEEYPNLLNQKSELDVEFIEKQCLKWDDDLGGNMRFEDMEDDLNMDLHDDPFFIAIIQIDKMTKEIKEKQDKRNDARKKYGKTLESLRTTSDIHE